MAQQDQDANGGPRFISAHEVAQEAGVSRSAVSRTFTPGASVSAATREKVLKAADKLGYQVNDLARGLLAHRSRIVGMIAADPDSPFRARQIATLSRRLAARGNVPVLIPTGQHGENLSAAHEALLRYRAEATVVLSGMPSSSFVELAQRNGQPLILVGRTEAGADHVHANNKLAAETAVDVFAARGFKKLGLITSNVGSYSLVEREQAFVAKANSLGLPVVIQRGELTDYDSGFAAGSLLLGDKARVEAVLCVNDLMAFGLMDCARDVYNLSIPDDLSIIGFDNVAEARWGAYRLTTFDQNAERLSAEIVRLLDERENAPNEPPQTVVLDMPLILRGSVRPLKTDHAAKGAKGACPMTFHSVWLRPSRGDLKFLETIVRDLALRFDTPVFEPHATLIPDMERSAEELQPLVLSLAMGRKPLDIRIEGIAATEAYFRSFYAELDKTPPLMDLKRDTIGISGLDDLASFVPHVSLAYGVPDTPEKHDEMKRLSDALSGRTLRFDRMVIVSSSSMTPIDQWIVKNEIYLAG